MISVILSTIPTYYLSFFSLPTLVEREIDSFRRRFMWNGTHNEGKPFCLLNWKKVCKCKKFGGLGIINLRDFNKALLLRLWWKLLSELNRKWALLVSHSYRPLTGWWSDRCTNGTSSSPFWKGIRSVKDIFFSLASRWRLGVGGAQDSGLTNGVPLFLCMSCPKVVCHSLRPCRTDVFALVSRRLEYQSSTIGPGRTHQPNL